MAYKLLATQENVICFWFTRWLVYCPFAVNTEATLANKRTAEMTFLRGRKCAPPPLKARSMQKWLQQRLLPLHAGSHGVAWEIKTERIERNHMYPSLYPNDHWQEIESYAADHSSRSSGCVRTAALVKFFRMSGSSWGMSICWAQNIVSGRGMAAI